MTTNNYTPGPWAYEYDDADGGFTVWLTESHGSYEPQHRIHFASGMWSHYTDGELSPAEQEQFDEAAANARLIAAAPELVAALEALAYIAEATEPLPVGGYEAWLNAANLLARVRGESEGGEG